MRAVYYQVGSLPAVYRVLILKPQKMQKIGPPKAWLKLDTFCTKIHKIIALIIIIITTKTQIAQPTIYRKNKNNHNNYLLGHIGYKHFLSLDRLVFIILIIETWGNLFIYKQNNTLAC